MTNFEEGKKTVKWTGFTCVLPDYGVATTNEEITLPTTVADFFVESGKAEEITTKKTTTKVSEVSSDG